MKYYIYYNQDNYNTTDDFLCYLGHVECNRHDVKHAVVGYLIECLGKRRAVPYFVEASIGQMIVDDDEAHAIDPHGHGYVNEMYSSVYEKKMEDILPNEGLVLGLYKQWTTEEDEPLVVVGEDDMCAGFILRMFPPVEGMT